MHPISYVRKLLRKKIGVRKELLHIRPAFSADDIRNEPDGRTRMRDLVKNGEILSCLLVEIKAPGEETREFDAFFEAIE